MYSWNFLDKYGRLKNNLFCQVEQCIWFGILGRVCFLCYDFPCVALFNLSNLNMYAMMQCKAKSENLAHILGYQFWAVIHRLLLRPLLDGGSVCRPRWPRRCRLFDHLLHAVLHRRRSRRSSRRWRCLFSHLLRTTLRHGRSCRLNWRRRHLFNHFLRAVLARGRNNRLLRLASRRRLRGDAGGLSKLAEPPSLWLRRLPERKAKSKILQGGFPEAKR